MNYKEALALVVEKVPEAAEIIAQHVAGLNSESADRRVKLADAAKIIEALKRIAGDDADLVKFAEESKTKAESTDKTVADLQAKLEAALVIAASSERKVLILNASQKTGADQDALTTLLEGVANDKISVGESVTIDGKSLEDFATDKGKFWKNALFGGGSSPERVPTGGGTPEPAKTPVAVYLDTRAAELSKSLCN